MSNINPILPEILDQFEDKRRKLFKDLENQLREIYGNEHLFDAYEAIESLYQETTDPKIEEACEAIMEWCDKRDEDGV